jgi:hypothetical protein
VTTERIDGTGSGGFDVDAGAATGKAHAEPDHAAKRTFGPRVVIVVLSLLLPGLLVTAYCSGLGPVRPGTLADSDCYMRLVRVRDLYDTGAWYDATVYRANVPYGLVLHWTRPLDALLLAGAVPLTLVTDFETALFWWGAVLSPLLLAGTFLALIWAARPLLARGGPLLAALFLPSSLSVLAWCMAARPDHHSLLLLLFVLFLGFVLRLLEQPLGRATLLWAAAVGVLSLWVSVEAEITIAVATIVLALLWLRGDEDSLAKNLYFSLALCALTCVALVLERPWHNWLAVEFDRVSIVHCCLFGLLALFWTAVHLLQRHTGVLRHGAARLLLLLVGAVASALLVGWLFPGLYRGPLANLDADVAGLWLRHNTESAPLLGSGDISAVPFAGSLLLCLPFLVVWIVRSDRRSLWLFVSLSVVAFTLLSLPDRRWTGYPQTLLTLPLAQLVVQAWTWMDARLRGNARALLKGSFGAACFFFLTFAGIPLALTPASRAIDPSARLRKVSLLSICEYLENSQLWHDRHLRVLTDVYFGSEILYRTRHSVVGTGYHRDAQGILDTRAILTAASDEDAWRLKERGIDVILLCPDSTEGHFYVQANASTLYGRLCEGRLPSWCREVTLPKELAGSFRLFAVTGR